MQLQLGRNGYHTAFVAESQRLARCLCRQARNLGDLGVLTRFLIMRIGRQNAFVDDWVDSGESACIGGRAYKSDLGWER